MKKIIISMLFCLVAVYICGQNVCWYYQGQKICYEISDTEFLINSETLDITGIENALQNPVAGHLKNVDDLGDGLFFIEMEHTSKEDIWELQRQFSSRGDVTYTSPLFGDEPKTGYTNVVLVRINSEEDYPVLQEYAEVYSITAIKKNFSGSYVLTLPHNPEKDAAEIALELYETGLFVYVEADFILIRPFASNDTYFNQQWGLKGDPADIGIKAERAWTTTTGSSSIKIAIVDTGVDLNHPDLVNNLLTGYNGYNGANNGAPTNTTSGDFPHGTKCAGTAAAQGNNSKGIIGVAHGCKILPVTGGASGYMNRDATTNGINWAWHNGADVISMSFGGTTPHNGWKLAIDSAMTFGRNGKGCVLVACAHNQGQPNVTFPASDANVIAVGAILNNGQRKIESNHGPNLDVVAPGEGIYTTGMLGTTENTVIDDGANGVYFSDFSATSAATPHVAGIAALILSVNNNLTAAEVRSIIRMTAQKLNGYAYQTTATHPDGSWNNEVGYGLVDAEAAVQAANCISSLSSTVQSNKFIRSCNNNFNISSSVTVTNNSKLTVRAKETSVNLSSSGEFKVNTGSQFEIR